MDPGTQIKEPIILLVEGEDEKLFFKYFLRFLKDTEGHIWDHLDNLQVISYDGTSNFEINLELVLTYLDGFEKIKRVGIIRDADCDAEKAFSMVKNALVKIKIKSPDRQLDWSNGNPNIIIMIVPESGKGSMEKYFLESVKGDPAMECVNNYFSCLTIFYDNKKLQKPENIYKSKLHAFLSSRKVPKASYGGGAQKDYWTYSDPAFLRIKDFLKQLIN